MYNHAPKKYFCPFCQLASGKDHKEVASRQRDIIYKDKNIMIFIASSWWPNNPGHVLIVPKKHYENIYDLPESLLIKIQKMGKKIVLVLKKTYNCSGTSFRQHNESDGGQDVWHYHLQVFPRYKNDRLYELDKERKDTIPSQRKPYVEKLRKYLKKYV
jgi:histidine triad (HIT) family protein